MSRLEILAPAGDAESLQAAVWAGADSVYLGLQAFNARRGAGNFTPAALKEAVRFCHANGVTVHVTLNTLVHADEWEDVRRALYDICAAGADAVLVQDWAVADLARREAPDLKLHASTQLAVTDLAGARLAAEYGFARVVLARELSAEEIATVTAGCGIQTEVFVHGAQCMGLSGQCYLSAFFGGRSGNRGACAQPCRQPCTAFLGEKVPPMPPAGHHLSLKDMSALRHLPALAALGVASVKIEGRLRAPEYVAAAVHAARLAREGQPYDEELLRQAFSRSGFTDGYFTGVRGAGMFGVRTPEDTAASRAAAPKIREYYRRPLQRVPVEMTLTLTETQARLTAGDGVHKAEATAALPAGEAPGPGYPEAVRRSLQKSGGTPFLVKDERLAVNGAEQYFLPLAQVNALRRQALDTLYQLRAETPPLPFWGAGTAPGKDGMPDQTAAAQAGDGVQTANAARMDAAARGGVAPVHGKATPASPAQLVARLETPAQLPPALAGTFRWLILPLRQAENIPAALRDRTVLELPRGNFGDSAPLAAQLKAAAALGFTRFEAQNPGHLQLLRQLAQSGGAGDGESAEIANGAKDAQSAGRTERSKNILDAASTACTKSLSNAGVEIWGGFPLNILNPAAAQQLAALGVRVQTLSCEVRADELPAFAQGRAGVRTALLAYGRLPVMLTRACPLQNVTDCAACPKRGRLLDRKGELLPVVCRGAVREIYNPVPLWLGDRQRELPCDLLTLYFTWESAARVEAVTRRFVAGQPLDARYTRGLYYAPRAAGG